ncbi:MAG: branched-chain amino acid ABC transporter permease [Deltaproteobacteria bacterium]|nr:branched-chain amino acid ABC transporter permease [Deltaproteobacteria bacterium]
MMNKTIKWIIWVTLLVCLLIYPKIFGIYYTNVFVTFAIFALFATSFNLLLGFTGLLSFGHAMYFGAGGFGTAIALTHIQGLPLLVSVLIGFVSAVVLAIILSPIVVRVSGTAFAMLHLAFSQLMFVLVLKLRGITGGEDGVGGFPIPPFSIPGIISIDIMDPLKFYYFAIIVLGISILILWFFTKTPFGQIMVSIRDNPNRVNYMGFRVTLSKAVIYVVAGGFAGIAGSIYALFQNLISAEELSIMACFAPIMITMVGGVGSFFGPILGSGVFAFLEELTSRYTEHVELVQGLILILVILFMPMGLIGIFHIIKEKLFSKPSLQGTMESAS